MSDLVKRLRYKVPDLITEAVGMYDDWMPEDREIVDICTEAVDRIEELEKHITVQNQVLSECQLIGRVKELENQWVSVKDRLPRTRCLAYTPNNEDVSISYRIIPAGIFGQVATDASHWMPLPSPPSTEA